MATIFVRSELGSQDMFLRPLAQRVFVIEGMRDRRRASALIDQNGYAVGGLARGEGGSDGEQVRTVPRARRIPFRGPGAITCGVERLHRIAIDSHRHVFYLLAPYAGADPNSSSHNLTRICRIHDEPPVAGRGDDDQRPFRYGFEFQLITPASSVVTGKPTGPSSTCPVERVAA